MMPYIQKLRSNDRAISPVIGTILMVAATVIVAGAVYAAINAYSGRASKETVDAAFRAQAVDTNANGLEDTIKITYLSGPAGAADIQATVKNATSGATITGTGSMPSDPGDFISYKPSLAGGYFVTVTLGTTTYVDQTLQLRE